MKKNIYFFTRLLIIFTPLCLAMENNTISTTHQAEIIQTITAINNPLSTFYLNNNNEVIIIGVDKHVVYDTDTNTITTVLAEYEKENVSSITSINQKNDTLAVTQDFYLKIYEIPHGNILWQGDAPQYDQSVFNSSDDTLCMFPYNLHYTLNYFAIDYKKDFTLAMILNQDFTQPPIRFSSIVYSQNSDALICISCQHIAKICNNTTMPFYTFSEEKRNIGKSTCNNKGNIFVFDCFDRADNSIHVVNTALKTEKILIKTNHFTTMVMKFLPNSDILATITAADNKIKFWNVHTQKLIAAILLDELCYSTPTHLYINSNSQERMNISPDGTQLILTNLRKCYVIRIPFDAQYLPDTQQKCIFTFCLLNRMSNLPLDVIRYLVYNLLVAHKYSFTTY